MGPKLLYLTALLGFVLPSAVAIKCYRCHSSQAGCGKELNIRLQRWHSCEAPAYGGGENFCVKVINRYGAEEHITRECLMTLRAHTDHREQMPTVQRHGYCLAGRNDDPDNRVNKDLTYCFCNDWNGCNTASGLQAKYLQTLLLGSMVALVVRLLL